MALGRQAIERDRAETVGRLQRLEAIARERGDVELAAKAQKDILLWSAPVTVYRLSQVAKAFARTQDVGQVLKALDDVIAPAGVQTMAVWPRKLRDPSEAMFGLSVSDKLKADSVNAVASCGPSILSGHAETMAAPFTIIGAMRLLQPSGQDRWIFDLFRDHRIKDGIYCHFGPYLASFTTSDSLLTEHAVSRDVKMAVGAARALAMGRLEELGLAARRVVSSKLSTRERIVLLHLSHGMSTAEIAARLELSEPSVKTFVRRAVKKLGAVSQLHAVAIAIRERLI